jgi:predicted metal-dependent phosphoesterase TrpH
MAIIPNVLRGIIHCHSKYSYDSITSIRSYLRFARKQHLDFVILTDHHTTKGSRALRDAAAVHMPHLDVPLAAEYFTDCGDVVAVFLKCEIQAIALKEFVDEARKQGAVLLLPHPYVSHKEIELVAEECDLIEAFNSRASDQQNAKAAELAANINKRTYAGGDAHLSNSLGRVIVEVENRGDLRTSLLNGKLDWVAEKTPKWEIAASQMIKAWTKRDPSVAWNQVRGGFHYIRHRFVGQRSAESTSAKAGKSKGTDEV